MALNNTERAVLDAFEKHDNDPITFGLAMHHYFEDGEMEVERRLVALDLLDRYESGNPDPRLATFVEDRRRKSKTKNAFPKPQGRPAKREERVWTAVWTKLAMMDGVPELDAISIVGRRLNQSESNVASCLNEYRYGAENLAAYIQRTRA